MSIRQGNNIIAGTITSRIDDVLSPVSNNPVRNSVITNTLEKTVDRRNITNCILEIPNDIKLRTKNIYGIYKRLSEGQKLSDAEWVDLIFRGISDLDSNSLNYIKNCKKLSLSSNFITKIPDLHFDNLEILSLGRNKIR